MEKAIPTEIFLRPSVRRIDKRKERAVNELLIAAGIIGLILLIWRVLS